MVEQGGNNPDGTGIVFDAAGFSNTAPSAHDRQTSRAAQVSQNEEAGRASLNHPRASPQSVSAEDGAGCSMVHQPFLSTAPYQFAQTGIPSNAAPKKLPTSTTEQRRASWTPAKRLLPEELYEQAYSADTRNPNKTEREQHKAWAVQRLYEEFEYCIENKIRPDDLRQITSPVSRLSASNPWNDFQKSRFFAALLINDGHTVPTKLMQRKDLARVYWNRICSSEAEKAECLAALALEQAEDDAAAHLSSDPQLRTAHLASAPQPRSRTNLAMIKKARQRLQASLTSLVRVLLSPSFRSEALSLIDSSPFPFRKANIFSDNYSIEMFAIASSNLPETNKERFVVASVGGAAFALRQGWADKGQGPLVRDFAHCVAGTAIIADKRAEIVSAAWNAPVADKNVETKRQWYSIILKELFQSALRRRSVLDGEKIQSPKFVYDVKALRDNARIIVQRGALLRKADFRSPSGKLKLLGPDLDRIIPLLRAGELKFRLEEEVIGSTMLTGGLGTRAPTRTASEVTMAELSAPAGLVDAHAVRRSWLVRGQNSLDNTGHRSRYFIVLLHMHPALGD
ncbi:BZ3500_MvSof-1268-A1-R1_Chr1-1g01165 [Microbotryum saponariae]|uniref:BZ3500_MvSof-1268-A1-R1_Chr1-1g01165 protein n=1 Tax=Microbotryum saponariae TaxID=289078 RepID=A0A2X0L478_9BASI|nr:BZ3500_MvSof-1268-A1-R1_Chr1-1g01165 [Microbotryum saponariae]SCZ93551.1 BZ3501_MvSof-1269-A2-R1_Chr1-1g00761 [Microbotryum saponariae]